MKHADPGACPEVGPHGSKRLVHHLEGVRSPALLSAVLLRPPWQPRGVPFPPGPSRARGGGPPLTPSGPAAPVLAAGSTQELAALSRPVAVSAAVRPVAGGRQGRLHECSSVRQCLVPWEL